VHLEMLMTARRLIETNVGDQATRLDLRRAVSSAYYALFHFVAQSCTEIFLPKRSKALSRARLQAYRSIDHRDIKSACILTKDPRYGSPQSMRAFAEVFLTMNKHRERADYDPSAIGDFHPEQARYLIDACDTAIGSFNATDIDDRRAFAVQVCLKSKARA
jgi:hypothetical protein